MMCIAPYTRRLGLFGQCAIATSILAGCVSFPPPERGVNDLVLSDAFRMYGPTAETPDRWWERFDSPALNALVDEALSENFSLRQAVARMEQAVAVARQNRAALFPEADVSADFSATANHQATGSGALRAASTSQRLEALGILSGAPQTRAAGNGEGTITSESYGLGIAANYEVDLWGRLRSGTRAALLDVSATTEDLYAAMQTVVGQVVLTWLDLLQVRQTLDVTRAQLETNLTTLELIELRFSKGLATALDVFQQRQVIAQTESILPPLESQHEVLAHELAVLLGKAPRTPLELGGDAFPEPGPYPHYGLPADLLARRPDVRAAGLRLQAADWRVSVAKADRLPALFLAGGFSFSGDEFDMIFDNWLATLAGSLTGPVFDAGRRRAEVERTQAVANERLDAYRLVVLTSIGEVENALVQMDRQQAFIDALGRRLEAANNSHTEALNRYRKGLNDYLPVLTALTVAQNLERSTVGAEHDLLVFRVQLHLALGGDWMVSMPPGALEVAGE